MLLVACIVTVEVRSIYKTMYTEFAHSEAEVLVQKVQRLLNLGLKPHEFHGFGEVCQTLVEGSQELEYVGLLDNKRFELYGAGNLQVDPVPLRPWTDDSAQSGQHNAILLPIVRPHHDKLYILIGISTKAIEESAQSVVGNLIWSIGVASTIGLVLLMYLLKRHCGDPVQRLVQQIDKIDLSDKKKPHLAFVSREDELGIISRSFMALVERLFSANLHLSGLKESLEKKVEKRTLELETANRSLAEIARTDPLTKLSNRFDFNDKVDRIFEEEGCREGFALLLFDLDKFKQINDVYGHVVGDIVLQEVGERLNNSEFKRFDCFRFGGDEFVIFIRNISSELELRRITHNLHELLTVPIKVEGQTTLKVGVSIGVATINENSDSIKNADQLLSKADEAMYKAKKSASDFVISA